MTRSAFSSKLIDLWQNARLVFPRIVDDKSPDLSLSARFARRLSRRRDGLPFLVLLKNYICYIVQIAFQVIFPDCPDTTIPKMAILFVSKITCSTENPFTAAIRSDHPRLNLGRS
jgi:hypothetical protein